MVFLFLNLNFNSIETLLGFDSCTAFTHNSATVFHEDIDIVSIIVDYAISIYTEEQCH